MTKFKIVMIVVVVFALMLSGCTSQRSVNNRPYKIASTAANVYDPAGSIRLHQRNNTSARNRQYSSEDELAIMSGHNGRNQMKYIASPLQTASMQGYTVGTGDILGIKIYQLLEPGKEATLKTQIDSSGHVYLPLLNKVYVAGMTVGQIQQELVRLLSSQYIRDPKVDVSMDSYSSKKVMVLGQVRKPGAVALQMNHSTLLDVLSDAGGLDVNVAPNIEILRGAYDTMVSDSTWNGDISGVSSKYRRELVPISMLFAESGQMQVNPVIYPGDVVKVRPGTEGYIYISGEVSRPGAKTFHRPFTVLQAVSTAGGTTWVASDEKCKIIRRTATGVEREIIVDLKKIRTGEHENILLARNDTLLVPANPTRKFFRGLGGFVRTGVRVTYDAAEDMGIPSGH